MESTGGRYVTIPRGALSRLLVEKITGSAEIILEDDTPCGNARIASRWNWREQYVRGRRASPRLAFMIIINSWRSQLLIITKNEGRGGGPKRPAQRR